MTARDAERPPSILFIHNNFPAQFGRLGQWLAQQGWSVAFATAAADAVAEGLRVLSYAPHREPHRGVHPYALPMERAALYAQAFARAGLAARSGGFHPDVVVAHSGWGAGMCARDVFPHAAFVAYCEWWYNHPGVDVTYLAALGHLPAQTTVEAPMFERMRNAPIAMDIAAADAVLCPTRFQAAQFPERLRDLLTIEHDGVDVEFYSPLPADRRTTLGGVVSPDAHVVTYATRGMEPHRGFPQFMAALPRVFAADPKAVAVIAGENRVAYGGDALRRTDWRAEALKAQDIDPARLHFVGRLPPRDYLALLRRSDAHVYLTVPFVLSWSMLEAMSVGCALVLSDTAPVREFADSESARLVDMRSPEAIAEAVVETLRDPDQSAARRTRARASVAQSISLGACFERKRQVFADLIGRSASSARHATDAQVAETPDVLNRYKGGR